MSSRSIIKNKISELIFKEKQANNTLLSDGEQSDTLLSDENIADHLLSKTEQVKYIKMNIDRLVIYLFYTILKNCFI